MTLSPRYADLIERVLWTGAQGFAAEWLVTRSFDGQTLQVAGAAALAAVAKCLIAFKVGSRNTAATLPVEEDTPEEADYVEPDYTPAPLVVRARER